MFGEGQVGGTNEAADAAADAAAEAERDDREAAVSGREPVVEQTFDYSAYDGNQNLSPGEQERNDAQQRAMAKEADQVTADAQAAIDERLWTVFWSSTGR